MIKWTIVNLEYEVHKDGKDKVVSKIKYHAWDGDGDGMGQVFGIVHMDTDVIEEVEAVEAQDAVYETVVVQEAVEAREQIEWEDKPTLDNTKDEIQSFMDYNSLSYNSGDTKQDLLDKIPELKQEAVEAVEEVTEEQLVSKAVPAVEGVDYYDPLENFVEWDDLTENKCIEWVKESLGESGIKSVESKIEKIWLESKEPSTGSGKPF